MNEDRQTIELRQKAEAACSIAAHPQRMATHDPRELPCLACGVIRLLDALAGCQRERDEALKKYAEYHARFDVASDQALHMAHRAERAGAEVARLQAVWDNWTRENLALAEVARAQAMGPLSPSNFSPEAVDPRG